MRRRKWRGEGGGAAEVAGIVAAPVGFVLGGGRAGGIDRAQGVGDDRAAQGRGAAPSVRGLRKLNAHGGSCRRVAPLTVAIFGGNRQISDHATSLTAARRRSRSASAARWSMASRSEVDRSEARPART